MEEEIPTEVFVQQTSQPNLCEEVRPGMGHNQTAGTLEADVIDALDQCEKALVDAEGRTRESQIKAIASLYRLFRWLEDNPAEGDSFYVRSGIKWDSSVRHPAQPLVKHFMGNGERQNVLRSRLTIWAGAITEGLRNNVSHDGFETFIRGYKGGIDAAYRNAALSLNGKGKRGLRVDEYEAARAQYETETEFPELPRTAITDELLPGSYLAIIHIDEQRTPRLTARLDRDPSAVDAAYRNHVVDWAAIGKNPKVGNQVRARRRYPNAKPSVGKPVILHEDDAAVVEARTRHPHLVRDPTPNDWVLKSGEHSRKLGSHVTKGRWKGYPIFSISLEERATCPRS